MTTIRAAAFAAFLFTGIATAAGSNWPQFRGHGARGLAENDAGPESWSATQNIAWVRDIAGRGWSSPIVWGDRVFLTTAISYGEVEPAKKGLYFGGDRDKPPDAEHVWLAICLDLHSGDVLWEKEVHRGIPERPLHIKNSYASETPVTDGEHVYAYFGNVGLFCLDFNGDLKWERRWPVVKIRAEWGSAASPAFHGDRIYIVNDNEDQSFLEALDKRTGKTVWHVDRQEKSNWATPFVWETDARIEIVTPGSKKNRAYDLDGNLLWELGGSSSITIATPYTAHGLLYVSSGYILDRKKPIFAIRPGASGDISLEEGETSNEFVAWAQKMAAPYNPTTLVYGDLLYVLSDRGLLASYDARTGKLVYEPQRLGGADAYTASPWGYGGYLFCLNENGETTVVRAGPDFEVLHLNPLGPDEMALATPAIVGGKLLIRTAARLYSIE